VKRMYDNLRIGVVGEEDAILAFKAIGAVAVPAVTADEVTSALFKLSQDQVPVIFITEQAARMMPEALERYETTPDMAIIPIPGIMGTDGYGEARVRGNIIKAIGADIIFNQEKKEG
jgi:V/A-type H+-transporting ATPase subunit F